jgi:hypothetical protein
MLKQEEPFYENRTNNFATDMTGKALQYKKEAAILRLKTGRAIGIPTEIK